MPEDLKQQFAAAIQRLEDRFAAYTADGFSTKEVCMRRILPRWGLAALLLGFLWSPPWAAENSSRRAQLLPDGRLAVEIVGPGHPTMHYTVQADVAVVYQCLAAEQACPPVVNKQELASTVLGSGTLKVMPTITQVVAGLVYGELVLVPPAPTLLCHAAPPEESLDAAGADLDARASAARVMAVTYSRITVHNLTLGTSGLAAPSTVAATFHECP